MDLVREILIRLERGESSDSIFSSIKKPYDELVYHFKIMNDYGLIEAYFIAPMNKSPNRSPLTLMATPSLTWEGYDFLDDIRNETVWKKTQTQIKKTTGTASLEMVKEVAKTFVREMLLGGLA